MSARVFRRTCVAVVVFLAWIGIQPALKSPEAAPVRPPAFRAPVPPSSSPDKDADKQPKPETHPEHGAHS